jgi:Domain of unknown function (DUF4123)
MEAAVIDRVIETLWPPGSPPGHSVWAILDSARDQRIFPALKLSRLEYISLYSGKLPDALQRAAPYLIELAPSYKFTRPLLEMGWGNSWGIFLRIKDARNLRHHLRGFLRVQDESGRTLVFRYYDPRVLRAYLPTCTKEELAAVFGPISSFLMEGDRGESLVEFEFNGGPLAERTTRLVAPTTP